MNERSTVFFYYSGHGAPDPRAGQAYLVPSDGDAMFLQSTALPLKQVYGALAKLPARRVIVVLDACFSGVAGRSVIARGTRPLVLRTQELIAGGRTTVLAASSGEETSGALDAQGHGLFTYYLLQGLSAGRRSTRALLDYLKPLVEDEARRQNREQVPVQLGEPTVL